MSPSGCSASVTGFEQRVGDAAAGGQHHRLARIRGRLDDVGDAAEAVGVCDARAAEFMHDPVVHASHAPRRTEA